MKTRVISSVYEDYLSPECSTAAKTTFDAYFQCQSIWIRGEIKGHLASNKMLEKSIKDHTIVVGFYAQWLVSNSRRKEAIGNKIMYIKLKYKVDDISSSTGSVAKSIN